MESKEEILDAKLEEKEELKAWRPDYGKKTDGRIPNKTDKTNGAKGCHEL